MFCAEIANIDGGGRINALGIFSNITGQAGKPQFRFSVAATLRTSEYSRKNSTKTNFVFKNPAGEQIFETPPMDASKMENPGAQEFIHFVMDIFGDMMPEYGVYTMNVMHEGKCIRSLEIPMVQG